MDPENVSEMKMPENIDQIAEIDAKLAELEQQAGQIDQQIVELRNKRMRAVKPAISHIDTSLPAATLEQAPVEASAPPASELTPLEIKVPSLAEPAFLTKDNNPIVAKAEARPFWEQTQYGQTPAPAPETPMVDSPRAEHPVVLGPDQAAPGLGGFRYPGTSVPEAAPVPPAAEPVVETAPEPAKPGLGRTMLDRFNAIVRKG